MKANTKDWIQYSAALLLIISAVIMAFVSFTLTLDVGTGPLAYIAEALSSSLAIFGISAFVVKNVNEMRKDIKKELNRINTP